jgi:hypothetical protein
LLQENDYVMKCIMRVISSSSASQYAEGVLAQLTDILKTVCKNPTQPGFNHYLFEAVAALIKQTCAANRAQVAVFEDKLFDVFQIVLQEGEQAGGQKCLSAELLYQSFRASISGRLWRQGLGVFWTRFAGR